MWSYDTGYVWTSLVTDCRENQVQTLPFGTPCCQGLSNVVSNQVGYSRSQHPRTRLSLLRWKVWSGCSTFKTGLISTGVLCRCTKSVERPAHWLKSCISKWVQSFVALHKLANRPDRAAKSWAWKNITWFCHAMFYPHYHSYRGNTTEIVPITTVTAVLLR